MGRHSPNRKKLQEKQEKARAARAQLRTAQAQRRAGVPAVPPVDPAFLDDEEDEDDDDASGTLGKMRAGIKTAVGTEEVASKPRSRLPVLILAVVVIAAIVGFVLSR